MLLDVLLIVGWLGSVIALLLYIRDKDAAVAEERATLLTRIQAPEVETLKTFTVDEPQYVPYGDDKAYFEYQEKQRELSSRV